jgi:adenylate kinase
MNKIETIPVSQTFHSPILLQDKVGQFLNLFFHGESHIKSQLTSFSNRNFKIQDATGKMWVLRIPNEVSHHLCNYKQEQLILDWAYAEGFSSLKVHGYEEKEGYLLTPFLSGSSLCADEFKNSSNLQEALKILHRLHTSKTAPFTIEFDLLERYSTTSEQAAHEGFPFTEQIHEIAGYLKFHLSQIPKDRFQKAPCHNDPSPENFFRQDGHLYLHDWELARFNDPMWDLAHLSVIGQIEPEKLLSFYPTSDPLAKEKIILFQAFVFFNTIVWAALESKKPSSSLSKETVDMLYQTFLDKTRALIQSAPFKTALKTINQGIHHMSVQPILASSAEAFPDFKPKTQISTLFLEHNNHLLLLMRSHKEDQPDTWGVPGGKAEKGETPIQTVLRELKEETQLTLSESEVRYHGHRYARIPGWDYIIHLYHAQLTDRPQITLDAKEHSKYEWVSIYAFKLMPLLKGQDEAFDILYGNRIWQRLDPKTSSKLQRVQNAAFLVLRKGNQTLTFDPKRRLVLNLIGTSGSGKGTQGDMLSRLFGIPNVSAGDLFRDEFRAGSKLGSMIQDFDTKYYPDYLPDEIPIGMMTKQIARPDCQLGFILDGFPRTKTQGDATREVILRKGDLHIPLFMDVPESDIWERLPGRSICPDCGHQVRKFDENPWPGFCPVEGATGKMVKLEQRPEDIDTRKTQRRLKMFADNREGILQSMTERDPVERFELDNKIPPREVLHLLCSHIQTRLDQLAENEQKEAPSSLKNQSWVISQTAFWSCTLFVTLVAGAIFITKRGTR